MYNVHTDHLGAPRIVTNASEQIVWRWDSAESYGGSAPDQNPSGLGTFAFSQRFPGQVFDAETGLFQNWRREYNPRIGGYMESDPIGLGGGINTYEYVGGSPTMMVDPTGEMGQGGRSGGWTKVDKGSGVPAPLGEAAILMISLAGGLGAGVAIGEGITAATVKAMPWLVPGLTIGTGGALSNSLWSSFIMHKNAVDTTVDGVTGFCTGFGSGGFAGKFFGPAFMNANSQLKTYGAQMLARLPSNIYNTALGQMNNPTEFSDGTVGVDYQSAVTQFAISELVGAAVNAPQMAKWSAGPGTLPGTMATNAPIERIGNGGVWIAEFQLVTKLANSVVDKANRDAAKNPSPHRGCSCTGK